MTNRSEIREYVSDALSAVAPNTYASRGYAVSGNVKLPAVVVYIPRERVEYQTIGPTVEAMRELQLIVEFFSDGSSSDIETVLDDAADEIELVLLRDMSLGDLVENMMLSGSESTVDTEKGSDRPLGVLQMTFTVQYRTTIEVI